MDMKDRLRAARAAKGLTQLQVADAVGIRQPTYADLENGKSKGSSHLHRIAEVLGVTTRYLETGEGTGPVPIESTLNTTRLSPKVWDSEDEIDGKDFMWAAMEAEEINGGSNGTESQGEIYEAPFRRSWLKQEGVKPENFVVMRVSGRSMEPVLWDGQVVGINKGDTKIVDGEIFAVRLDNHLMVKTLTKDLANKQVVLHSENEDKRVFPDIRLDEELAAARLTVVGNVFWMAGRPRGRR